MTQATPAVGSDTLGPASVITAEPRHSNIPLVRLTILGGFAMVLGLAVVGWLAQLGQLSLHGYLKAEQAVVYAPRSGRVIELGAKSGEAVKPRQPLMQLVDDSLDREIAIASLEVRSLEAGLKQCRAKAEVQISQEVETIEDKLLKIRLDTTKYLFDHQLAQLECADVRAIVRTSSRSQWLAVGPDTMNNPQRLFGPHDPAPVVPEEAKIRAIRKQVEAKTAAEYAKTAADNCELRIQALQQHREALPEKIRKAAGVDVAESRLALATQQLQALQLQKAELTILSKGHGIVGEFLKQSGDPVMAGERLVMVLDRDRPYIEVDVPSRRINTIKVGQSMRLEFADEDFSGRIEAISPQAHRRDGSEDTWIPVRIGQAGKLWPEMPIGTAVSVRLK